MPGSFIHGTAQIRPCVQLQVRAIEKVHLGAHVEPVNRFGQHGGAFVQPGLGVAVLAAVKNCPGYVPKQLAETEPAKLDHVQ